MIICPIINMIGGSTGLQFFRPPLTDPIEGAFESKALLIYSNVFYRNWASVAFVGTVESRVINNTIIQPLNWVFRILQETTTQGFLSCSNNTFANNLIYMENDLTEVNIGPNTLPETFTLSNNLWFNESNDSWTPNLPVTDLNQIIQDPLLLNPQEADYLIDKDSPAVGAGLYFNDVLFDIEGMSFLNPPTIGAFEASEVSFIDEPELSFGSFYPIPASDHLCFDFGELEKSDYIISDINGNMVTQGKLENSCIELPELANGVYIFRFGLKHIYSQKIIIKKN